MYAAHAVTTLARHDEGSKDRELHSAVTCSMSFPVNKQHLDPLTQEITTTDALMKPEFARCPTAIHVDQSRQSFPLLGWVITEVKVEQPSRQNPTASPVCTRRARGGCPVAGA